MDDHVVRLNFLSETMKRISQSRDWEESLDKIFEFTRTLLDYSMMVIYMINEDRGELEVVAVRGSSKVEIKQRTKFKIGEGIVGWVAREKKAVFLRDAILEKKFRVRQEDPPIRSFIAVPLMFENKVIGIMTISSTKPNIYNEKDVQMISIIASQVAVIYRINTILRDKTNLSNHILQSINSGVIVIDKDAKIILFNKAAEEITGYTSDELIGIEIAETPLRKSPSYWYLLKTHETNKPFFEKETYMTNKEGREIPIVISITVLRDDRGMFNGVTAVFRDLLEVKRIQEEIRRTDRLASLGRLTIGVAHEIRNPLLPIRTAAEVMLKKTNPMDERYTLLKIIKEEGERLNSILNDFVSYSKPSSETRVFFDLNKLIRKTIELFRHELKNKKIEIHTNLWRERFDILASPQEFRQVLINLILNAIDALPRGGQISITTELEEEQVKLVIEDTGCGIAPDDIEKIFDPFFTRKKEGTGLGLFIVHNIITKYGGRILVNSSLGKGTSFIIKTKKIKGGL